MIKPLMAAVNVTDSAVLAGTWNHKDKHPTFNTQTHTQTHRHTHTHTDTQTHTHRQTDRHSARETGEFVVIEVAR